MCPPAAAAPQSVPGAAFPEKWFYSAGGWQDRAVRRQEKALDGRQGGGPKHPSMGHLERAGRHRCRAECNRSLLQPRSAARRSAKRLLASGKPQGEATPRRSRLGRRSGERLDLCKRACPSYGPVAARFTRAALVLAGSRARRALREPKPRLASGRCVTRARRLRGRSPSVAAAASASPPCFPRGPRCCHTARRLSRPLPAGERAA